MKQAQTTIRLRTRGPGLYAFTDHAHKFVSRENISLGLLTCFIRHTSASLVIQENADPDVLRDLEDFMRRLVSRDPALYRHTAEGPDDMPSHIRSALMATSISIPLSEGGLLLGTWQELYLFEHRDAPHEREILLHLIGE
jgi:secondary thiamine-phosphate synthase enzyme